jgi:cytochrome o ubiquinol oxidase subunit 2
MCGIAGCTPAQQGFLAPASGLAAAQRDLLLWIVGLGLVVVLPVLILTPWLLWRYRHGRANAVYRPGWDFSLPMDCLTWGVPVLVVMVLGAMTWQRSHELDPYRPIPGPAKAIEVQVIALDWKWLFIYPDQGIASVNQLVIPAGRSVHLTLTSASVMQSLHIPRLAGQIYAMAGMRTQQYLQADEAGRYQGRNTQFNGEGFQDQIFSTLVLPPSGFERWLQETRGAATALSCQGYRQLSNASTFADVHRYSGVPTGLFDNVVQAFHSPAHSQCREQAQEQRHE